MGLTFTTFIRTTFLKGSTGFTCVKCLRNRLTLQVWHFTLKTGGLLWKWASEGLQLVMEILSRGRRRLSETRGNVLAPDVDGCGSVPQ